MLSCIHSSVRLFPDGSCVRVKPVASPALTSAALALASVSDGGIVTRFAPTGHPDLLLSHDKLTIPSILPMLHKAQQEINTLWCVQSTPSTKKRDKRAMMQSPTGFTLTHDPSGNNRTDE